MDSCIVSVISSATVSALVIIVPIIKSMFDKNIERKNRIYENEIKKKSEIYEEFFNITTSYDPVWPQIFYHSTKVCSYCDAETKKMVLRLMKNFDHNYIEPDDKTNMFDNASNEQARADGLFEAPYPLYIIYRIAECLNKEIQEANKLYQSNHFLKRKK